MSARSQSYTPGLPRRSSKEPVARRHRALEVSSWLFILVAVGRIGEIVPGLSTIPLVKIILGAALIALTVSWRALPRFSRAVIPLLKSESLLVVLVVLTLPISIWPGKSIAFLYQQLPVLVAAVMIVYKLSYSWRVIRSMFKTVVVAATVLMAMALIGYAGGRAAVESMYDTNDLAYVLVTAYPIAVAFATVSRSPRYRIPWMLIALGLIVTILLTSSRGGFVGLLASAAVIALFPARPATTKDGVPKSSKSRVALSLLAGVSVAVVIWPLLPSETRGRLETTFSLSGDYNLDEKNDKGRIQIWTRAMTALGQRPFGYGVDTFPMVDFRFGGRMMAPHNSFVQTAVELGVLGLYFFLRVYYLALKGLEEGRRRLLLAMAKNKELDERAVFCRMLQASVVGNFFAALFLSMAYVTLFWIIIALAMACISNAEATPPLE